MGRDLQKRKRRSSRQPIKQSQKTKKVLNPRGNTTIAQNWDKNETLVQNYRRLGLVARLKAPTGGSERKLHGKPAAAAPSRRSSFAIATAEESILSEVRVERDADGNITRIIRGDENPLNDPLNALESDGEEGDAAMEEWGGFDDPDATDVVKSLIEESKNPAEKKPRHQSEREMEWLGRLVAKYGEDSAAMARDRRLNPMQQTAADISKRIRKMNAA